MIESEADYQRYVADGEYACSQEPHPGQEVYGVNGGCAECGYSPRDEEYPL